MAIQVSHSKLKTWRGCRLQAYYRYVEKIEPRRKPKPLMLGSMVHSMLEERVEGGDPMDALKEYEQKFGRLFREEQEFYGDIVGEARGLVSGYASYYAEDGLKYHKIGRKRSEHRFEVTLAPGVTLVGVVDAIASTADDRTWAMEHKTKTSIPDEEDRFFDLQTGIYTEFPGEFGLKKFDGVLWDYVRKKLPRVPELLKKGGLSKAKSIDTTWQVYHQAILDNGLNPADYEDMRQELKGKEGDFFKRVYMPRNKVLGKQLVEEVVTTAKDMEKSLGKDKTRTIDRHCKWCSYRLLCRSELLGMDADFVRKHDFQVREKRDAQAPQKPNRVKDRDED